MKTQNTKREIKITVLFLLLFTIHVSLFTAFIADAAFMKNSNFAKSTLDAVLGNAGIAEQTVKVQPGTGKIFPTGGRFRAVLWRKAYVTATDDPLREIITLQGNGSDTFSVVARGAEGTASRVWSKDDNIAHTLTAGKITELEAAIESKSLSEVGVHIAALAAHGAQGAVVGTTNAQTLTNKTITQPVISTPKLTLESDPQSLALGRFWYSGDQLKLWGFSFPGDADVKVFSDDASNAATYAPIASPTFTGTVGGITKTMVGLGSVNNTSDADKPISTAAQAALDLKAPLASPTFTGTVGGITKTMVGLGSVNNTSDVDKPISTDTQAALDLKAPLASPTFTGTVGGITKTMVGLSNVNNTSDTGKPVSTATQAALDLKAPLASPTFTGTVGGITKTMVGLSNVNNTSDADKPVSTAAQAALDLKAPIESPTFTGTVTTTSPVINTPKLTLESDPQSLALGRFWYSGDQLKLWGFSFPGDAAVKVFSDDASNAATYAPLNSPTFTGTVGGITKTMVGLGSVNNTSDADKPISTAAQAALDLKAPLASPTFTGTVGGITKTMVGLSNVNNTSDANKPVSAATQAALDLKAALSHTSDLAAHGRVIKVTTALFDKTDTTASLISGLEKQLESGKTYFFRAVLFVDASAAGGHKYKANFGGNETSVIYYVSSVCDATGASVLTKRKIDFTASAGENASGCTALKTIIEGSIVVNTAGMLQMRFALNVASGTSFVLPGSTLEVVETD